MVGIFTTLIASGHPSSVVLCLASYCLCQLAWWTNFGLAGLKAIRPTSNSNTVITEQGTTETLIVLSSPSSEQAGSVGPPTVDQRALLTRPSQQQQSLMPWRDRPSDCFCNGLAMLKTQFQHCSNMPHTKTRPSAYQARVCY